MVGSRSIWTGREIGSNKYKITSRVRSCIQNKPSDKTRLVYRKTGSYIRHMFYRICFSLFHITGQFDSVFRSISHYCRISERLTATAAQAATKAANDSCQTHYFQSHFALRHWRSSGELWRCWTGRRRSDAAPRPPAPRPRAIIPALFLDTFGDPTTNPKGWPTVAVGDLSPCRIAEWGLPFEIRENSRQGSDAICNHTRVVRCVCCKGKYIRRTSRRTTIGFPKAVLNLPWKRKL